MSILAATRRRRRQRAAAAISMVLLSAACAPTRWHILTGAPKPPIAVSEVLVYFTPPAKFEQIALLTVARRTVFHTGGEKTTDALLSELAAEAAKLGANGIIVDQIFDKQSMSFGTGIGSDSYTHNADISLGIGAIFGVYKRTGDARAIFVPHE